jgi:hypothetical protein
MVSVEFTGVLDVGLAGFGDMVQVASVGHPATVKVTGVLNEPTALRASVPVAPDPAFTVALLAVPKVME